MKNAENVRLALDFAKAISWDGCHKIYVLMDDLQVEKQRELGYEHIITNSVPDASFMILQHWFKESCPLRFVEAVATTYPSEGMKFVTLIAQGEEDSVS